MITFTYLFCRYLTRYIKQSFQPPQLFNSETDDFLNKLIESPDKKYTLIKLFEAKGSDGTFAEEEKKRKRLHRLLILNFIIEYFGQSFSGFKGKKAYTIAWIYQLIGFLAISITYFTFMNFQLFIIDKDNFVTLKNPSLFDFYYYTLKTITFQNIDLIKPLSKLSMIFEISSFLTIGIFVLIIVVSILFSLRLDRIGENIKKATDICVSQKQLIAQHIQSQYNIEISSAFNEFENIRTSINNLKKIIDNIF